MKDSIQKNFNEIAIQKQNISLLCVLMKSSSELIFDTNIRLNFLCVAVAFFPFNLSPQASLSRKLPIETNAVVASRSNKVIRIFHVVDFNFLIIQKLMIDASLEINLHPCIL